MKALLRLINSSNLRISRTIGRLVAMFVLISVAISIGLLATSGASSTSRVSVAFIIAGLFGLAAAAFFLPVVAFEAVRRSRRNSLTRLFPKFTSYPVLLVPATRSFVAGDGSRYISYLVESAAVVAGSNELEFWLGGRQPILARSIQYGNIESALSGSVDGYLCIDIHVKEPRQKVPLLLAGPFLGINQRGVSKVLEEINDRISGVT